MNQKRLFILFLIIISIFGFFINTEIVNNENISDENKIISSDKYAVHPRELLTSLNDHMNIENEQDNDEYIPTITIDRTETVIEDYRYNITEDEFEEFVRVVEAEVTGDNPFGVGYEEAFKSKLRVAQVILNRVESPRFPNTVHDVIFQKNAFTPLVDGRYYSVEISDITIEACKIALRSATPDMTEQCLFFSSGTTECKYGSYVFTDFVGHSFFDAYEK